MSERTERAAGAVVRAVGRLPDPVLRVLAGRPHVVDGQRLYPEVQFALRLRRVVRAGEEEDVARARARVAREARLLGHRPQVGRVEDVTVPGTRGPVPARLYQGDPDVRPDGVVVYFHGGGWVLGDLETADPICRAIARHTKLLVLSVDYGLAPEHPFPQGLTDCVDAFRWARDAELWRPGVRVPVAVAGDSAGATLAAVVSILTRDDDAGGPAFQLLMYPATDLTRAYPSEKLFDGYALAAARLGWYRRRYIPDATLTADPRVSPLLTDDLSGVAPAHVAVAGFDVLRDEGLLYAERLRESGVPVSVQVVTGHVHAWANATGASRHSIAALAEAVRPLVAALRSAADVPGVGDDA